MLILLLGFFSITIQTKASVNDTSNVIYISLQGENTIVCYQINSLNGKLEKKFTQAVSGGPASLATNPENSCLFVARRSDKKISSFKIDQVTGQLTLINSITATDNPVYLSTDQSGKFLLSAYFSASKAAIYPIDNKGAIVANESQLISTGINPHAIKTDPQNRFLYITNMTGNKIMQNQFDSIGGTFLPLVPSEFVPVNTEGPRHMVFHGSKHILYVANEIGNSVSVYQYNPTSGTLSNFQTISTLPPEYKGTNKCADIHISPDQRFLYASNRGHGSIAAFNINANTDSISLIGFYPSVSSPREFDIDATGRYLYVAGETTNDLACYHIDSITGALDLIENLIVGKNPTWVKTVQLINYHNSAVNQLQHLPSNLELWNAPNPFDLSTAITFSINQTLLVKLSICDLWGNEIELLIEKELIAGTYNANWFPEPGLHKAGTYLCSLETKQGNKAIKLIKTQ